MNYEIIKNMDELQKFLDLLEPTEENERYYISLMARKKYDPSGVVKHDKQQLKRVLAKKEHIVSKIRQMESEVGTYEFDGQPVPVGSLVLYMTPSKRDLHRAKILTMKELMVHLEDEWVNPVSVALSSAHKATVKNPKYVDVDVDVKGGGSKNFLVKEIRHLIGDVFDLIYTRGGFHLLIREKEARTDWNALLMKMKKTYDMIEDIQINGAKGMCPVPGCAQGGDFPYVASVEEEGVIGTGF